MTFGDGGRRLDPSSQKVPDPQEGDQQTPEYQNMIGYVKSIKKKQVLVVVVVAWD